MLLATLGMMLMISANDLMSLYVGLELQSLALYVVAAFQRDIVALDRSRPEILRPGRGRLGHAAVRRLADLWLLRRHHASSQISAGADRRHGGAEIGTVIGLVFVVAGLAFKVSAVPFHMWTPDVYEGAPTPVTALLRRGAQDRRHVAAGLGPDRPVQPLFAQWQQIIVVASVAVDGARRLRRARASTNIKRLMAYSSIGNVGYALLGLAAGTEKGIQAVVFYMAIYLVMTLGHLRRHPADEAPRRHGRGHHRSGRPGADPSDAGASRMLLFMFSMAGIPPLAGFFGKLYVFLAAVEAKLYVAGRAGRAGLAWWRPTTTCASSR